MAEATAGYELSIIVPTYNEAGNILPLVDAIDAALQGTSYQLVFADDSDDETTAVITAAADRRPSIRVQHRSGRRGLASAVLDALPLVKSGKVVVIDGDLQHPPKLIPSLQRAADETGAEVVVASRYLLGGDAGGLAGPLRRLASRLTRLATYVLVPPARQTSDPLSGFFLFRPSILARAQMRPAGYKILLEILARGRPARVVDVPFVFERRRSERSKAGPREAWNFLRLLWRLRS